MFLRALFAALLVLSAACAQDEGCTALQLVHVTVQTNPDPSLPGQPVDIRVFVDPVQGDATPTGTVELSDTNVVLGTQPLKLGQAVFTRTFIESGGHSLAAVYSGDQTYCPLLGTGNHQVDHLTPTITLTSSNASADFGARVNLTAQVGAVPPAGVAAPNGPVQFVEGAAVLATGTLSSSGSATAAFANLAPGTHQISAVLVGDIVWYSVRSAALTQTIGRARTTTSLSAAPGVDITTLLATVATDPPGASTPDGTVQFLDAGRNVILGTTAVAAGGIAKVTITGAQVFASVGHPITAAYSGSANYSTSTSNPLGIPVAINAAGARNGALASDEIVSIYGYDLSAITAVAQSTALPENLGGYSVTVRDNSGTDRPAGLYAISPTQFNIVVPAGVASGVAAITLGAPAGRPSMPAFQVNTAAVAPGVFTISGDGKGTPAAQVIRVRSDGSQVTESLTSDGVKIGGDTVYLVLYGTGIRHRTALDNVSCVLGGANAAVSYAGPQSGSPGLDQINIAIPAALAGAGDVTLSLTVDGQPANPVTVRLL